MLKFNNNNLFTGYLKQILASSNLPTYRIYTDENKRYKQKYGKESPDIIETIPTSSYTYKNHIRYIPYIKDGYIMEYVFTEDSSSTNAENATGYSQWKIIDTYYPNKNSLNNLKNFKITNNIYDTYTHEYLGDYLRFLRDYYKLNLMPLYNCFSNQICQNLYIECNHTESEEKTKKHFLFNAKDSHFKIYMIPVKFFKEYTIAIDCDAEVEICCGIYGKYQEKDTDTYTILSHDTYKRYGHLYYNQPIIYSALTNIHNFLSKDSMQELATRESDLKLFIKLPAHNKSSITILEGNYLRYNDKYTRHQTKVGASGKIIDYKKELKNHCVTNMLDEETGLIITQDKYITDRTFVPITNLQLLTANTGVSYPFADRLIEYLSNNIITQLDPIEDNIERVQTVVKAASSNKITNTSGIWDSRLQPILYNFIQTHPNLYGEKNIDMFGHVDKTTEQLFNAKIKNQNSGLYETKTIASIDLYPDIYLAQKKENNT